MLVRLLVFGLFLFPFQEPPSEFARQLEAAEQTGLIVPEFLDAVAKLDALAGAKIPKDLAHRHQMLRAQAAILKSLHVRLTAIKGQAIDMPIAGGKTVQVKIMEVTNDSVLIKRPEFGQVIKFAELDSEWSVTLARPDFGSNPDARLWAGLWLAKAARWDAAIRELETVKSDHPLVLEAQHRGFAELMKRLDSSIAAKRWKEAVDRLAAAEKSAPGAPTVAKVRERLVQVVADLAKEHCRKGAKKPMEELIDLLAKNFPGREALISEIREEKRWILVSDPLKFGMMGNDREPIVLDPVGKSVLAVHVKEVPGTFDGISVRIRFTEDTKETHAGPLWMSKEGRITPYVVRNLALLKLMRLDEKAQKWAALDGGKVEPAESYEIRAILESGDLVVSVNGVVVIRWDAPGETEFQTPGMQASLGRITFDQFKLRKKP